MLNALLAAFGFLFFLLHDFNSVLWHSKWLRPAFFIGLCLLGAASVSAFAAAWRAQAPAPGIAWPLGAAALAFLALTAWALFFAIPFAQSYVPSAPGAAKPAPVQSGMYGLCRHPGVLWLVCMYVCLSVMLPQAAWLAFAALVCILDIAYALFQDRWVFPRLFSGYEAYRARVPFLIPRRQSFQKR